MNTFSFRAECQPDVDAFFAEAKASGLIVSIYSKQPDELPDVEVELTTNTSLDDLRGVLRRVVDGHVMLQTLRACALTENSLERNYDLH